MGIRGELYSTRVSSEKRTYFFNVKENRVGSVFLNIVESRKGDVDGEFNRQQIMVYEEELDSFVREMEKAISIMKKHRSLRQGSQAPDAPETE